MRSYSGSARCVTVAVSFEDVTVERVYVVEPAVVFVSAWWAVIA